MEVNIPLSTSTLFLQLDFPYSFAAHGPRPARGRGAWLRGGRRIVYNIAQSSPDGGCAVGRRGRDGAGGGPLREPGSHGSLTEAGAAPGHWPLA